MATTDNPRSDKSFPAIASELYDLVRAYAKQETIEPIKGLGRFVGYGALGSVLLGTGLVLVALGLLRLLQEETGDLFDGNWTVAPYLITVLAGTIPVALAARAVGSRR